MQRLSAYGLSGIGCRLERQGHTVQAQRVRQYPAHGCLGRQALTEQLRRTVSLQHCSQVLGLSFVAEKGATGAMTAPIGIGHVLRGHLRANALAAPDMGCNRLVP